MVKTVKVSANGLQSKNIHSLFKTREQILSTTTDTKHTERPSLRSKNVSISKISGKIERSQIFDLHKTSRHLVEDLVGIS